ncbi:MAG: TIGR04255 family protein [Brevundimonas sp.]|nr:TIGR04255 family protein [Brevundimonas sp.]
MDDRYAKPPITEAVIEIRAGDPLAEAKVRKAAKAIGKRYRQTEELREFTMTVGSNAPVASKVVGFRLVSEDALFVAQPRKKGLAFSALAPYPGWTAFTAEFTEVWKLWKKGTGGQRTDRIGVRFLNRIDIPHEEGKTLDSDDYLSVGIRLPLSTGNFSNAWQVGSLCPVQGTRFMVRIQCGTVKAAILNAASYSLDLDFYCEVDVPQSDNDILALLDEVKPIKNRVFEECITDKTRALLS